MHLGYRVNGPPWYNHISYPRRCRGLKTMKIGHFEPFWGLLRPQFWVLRWILMFISLFLHVDPLQSISWPQEPPFRVQDHQNWTIFTRVMIIWKIFPKCLILRTGQKNFGSSPVRPKLTFWPLWVLKISVLMLATTWNKFWKPHSNILRAVTQSLSLVDQIKNS